MVDKNWWMCDICESEWSYEYYFLYLEKQKYCMACEHEMSDDQLSRAHKLRLKSPIEKEEEEMKPEKKKKKVIVNPPKPQMDVDQVLGKPRQICKATMKSGKSCTAKAKVGTYYCGRHQKCHEGSSGEQSQNTKDTLEQEPRDNQ